MTDRAPLPPGSTIGILGGGQLGRMLAMAAARLGLRCHVFCPDPASPAFDVAARHTVADYGDLAALEAFAGGCDAVTVEFENVPAAALERLEQLVPVRPGARSLAICQDRVAEKSLVSDLGVPTADWRPAANLSELAAACAALGPATLLKTSRLGYDGKGQARLESWPSPEAAWDSVGRAPVIVEALVPFSREVSVVAVRARDGAFGAYDVAENTHDGGILRVSRVPAAIRPATADAARAVARQIGDALDHVGVFAVEMFVVGDEERLLVNEIAPRVHNSGHWTMEACPASQFEAHIRAVAAWPLPDTRRLADAEMTNLIGADVEGWQALAAEPGAALHLYGKAESRPGRKMGHVTRLGPLTPGTES